MDVFTFLMYIEETEYMRMNDVVSEIRDSCDASHIQRWADFYVDDVIADDIIDHELLARWTSRN